MSKEKKINFIITILLYGTQGLSLNGYIQRLTKNLILQKEIKKGNF